MCNLQPAHRPAIQKRANLADLAQPKHVRDQTKLLALRLLIMPTGKGLPEPILPGKVATPVTIARPYRPVGAAGAAKFATVNSDQLHYARNSGSVLTRMIITYVIEKGVPNKIYAPALPCAAALGLG